MLNAPASWSLELRPGSVQGGRAMAMIGRIAGRQLQRSLTRHSLYFSNAAVFQRLNVSAFLSGGESVHGSFTGSSVSNLAKGVSTCRMSSKDEEFPVQSPLSQVPSPPPPPEGAGGDGEEVAPPKRPKFKPSYVKAMRREIPQSPKKMNVVAKVVRGMRVNDALVQLSVLVKRAAASVYRVLHSARANAIHNQGWDPEKLIVSEAYVGKGTYLKRIWPHAKGRFGIRERKRCRLTIKVREMTEKELKLLEILRKKQARGSYIYRTKLLPHRIVETRWNRPRRIEGEPPEHRNDDQAHAS